MKYENISYAKTVYGKAEIKAVVDCLNKSTQMGVNARKFESKIAKLFDKKYGLFVNSGSSANLLAAFAAGNILRKKIWNSIIKNKTSVIPQILYKEITMEEVNTKIKNLQIFNFIFLMLMV